MIEGDQKNEESLETCDECRVKTGEEGRRHRAGAAGPAEGALGLTDRRAPEYAARPRQRPWLSGHA